MTDEHDCYSLFGETRERVIDKKTDYQPKVLESSWFLEEEGPNKCSTAEDLVCKANHYYYQKKWLQAAQCYLKVKDMLPEKSNLLHRLTLESLSRCYLHLGNYDASKAWAQKLLEVSQSSETKVIAHNLISQICHKLAHLDEEAEHLKFCLSRQPLNGIHWFHLGLTYLSKTTTCSPCTTDGSRKRSHHSKPQKAGDKTIRQEMNELESCISQTTITGDNEHASANGFEYSISHDEVYKDRMHQSCKAEGNRQHLKQDNVEETLRETSMKCNVHGVVDLKGLMKDEEVKQENGVGDEEKELQCLSPNGCKEGVPPEETRRRDSRNHDDDDDDVVKSKDGGNKRKNSCHQAITVTAPSMQDNIFALICFMRARILFRPNSSMCTVKSKQGLMEVERCIQSMDFPEAFVAEVRQLCWKRQFGLESKVNSKEAAGKEKDQSDSSNDQTEKMFEDFWFNDIVQQTISIMES